MLGNLHDYDPKQHAVPYEELPELDRYMLGRLAEDGAGGSNPDPDPGPHPDPDPDQNPEPEPEPEPEPKPEP